MSGFGCGRAIRKSDGEPAMVALQEAVKIARQSDSVLEKSPRDGSRSDDTNVEGVRARQDERCD